MDSRLTYRPADILLSFFLYLAYIFGKNDVLQQPEIRSKGLNHYVSSVKAEVRGIVYTLGENCTMGLLFVYDTDPRVRQFQLLFRSKSKRDIQCEYRLWLGIDDNGKLIIKDESASGFDDKEPAQFAALKSRLHRLIDMMKEQGISYQADLNFDETKFADVENFIVTSGLFDDENILERIGDNKYQLSSSFQKASLHIFNGPVVECMAFCPFFHRN